MQIKYKQIKFKFATLEIIGKAILILGEYADRGIIVTLRQLFYQFVTRDLIENKQSEYKSLGNIINNARLAGLIDWAYLQDRTRNLSRLSRWDSPADVIDSAAQGYHRDLWIGQPNYVECWIEKDALIGVIEGVCEQFDVPYFSCRGYTSQSEMWAAAQRLISRERNGQKTYILHLGDHDPSGVDMSRDIQDRLRLFGSTATVVRVALNMDQIKKYNPPPNPAKITDSRAVDYIRKFGVESRELDALDPDVLINLVQRNIEALINQGLFDAQTKRQESERGELTKASENWHRVSDFVEGL